MASHNYTRKEFNEYYGMQRAPQEWALATKLIRQATRLLHRQAKRSQGCTDRQHSAERGEVSPMQQSSVQSVSPRTEPQMRKQLSRYPYGIRTTGIPHQIFFVEEGPRILSCCQRTMILCADSAQKMRMGRR